MNFQNIAHRVVGIVLLAVSESLSHGHRLAILTVICKYQGIQSGKTEQLRTVSTTTWAFPVWGKPFGKMQ